VGGRGLEWVKEGAIVVEELTQGGGEDLGLEDCVEGVDPRDMVCCREGAMKDDVFLDVPCGALVGVKGVRAGEVHAQA